LYRRGVCGQKPQNSRPNSLVTRPANLVQNPAVSGSGDFPGVGTAVYSGKNNHMKTNMKVLAGLLFMMLAASVESVAQQKSNSYWVIEGNIKQPNYTIIHFYNGQDQKIGEIRVEGKFLSLTKRSHLRFLNRKLRELETRDSLTNRQSLKPRKQRG
jgi:hypothetical protein